MEFYVIEISTGNSSIAGKAIYEYDATEYGSDEVALNQAEANYHTKLGNAMKSELYESEMLMVINSEGGVHMPPHKYVKPKRNPESDGDV